MPQKLKPVGRKLENKPVVVQCRECVVIWDNGAGWQSRRFDTRDGDGDLHITVDRRGAPRKQQDK